MSRIFAVFLLLALLSFGQALAAEKQVGQPCSGDANAADWDTITQCNGSVFVKAPLLLGAVASPPYSSTACDSAKAGMLQYTTASGFSGCNGSTWSSLGSGSGSSILGASAAVTNPYKSSDLTTGLFSDTASAVSVATGGVARLIVTGTGSVGVGTTGPRALLDVKGQITGGFGAATTSGTADWNDSTNARSGNGYTLLLGSASNGPSASLAYYFHALGFEYASKDGSGNITQIAIPYSNTYGNGGDSLWIRTRYSGTWSAWRQILTENYNGRVGIGTVSPSYTLDVSGTGRFTGAVYGVTPTDSAHLATKAYVDAAAGGGTWTSQTFTSSGTWTYSSSYHDINIFAVGGGGGGGAPNVSYYGGGGGGGGGMTYMENGPVTGNLTITIGSGGAGGSGGGGSGSAGGNTTIYQSSTLLATAFGGSGAVSTNAGSGGVCFGVGSAGTCGGTGGQGYNDVAGSSSTNALFSRGSGGAAGSYSGGSQYAGSGGGGSYGAGGAGGTGDATGGSCTVGSSASANTGGGGGGGGGCASTAYRSGGSGGSGIVIIFWKQ